ncbi:unnamed protein product (macronuclear) [Paramecium tetraurelia]|uniref:Transmembrane protein n=1 Tax=Paramecium tetraurelia TaxID=5888 RepID=A0D648_PARTE|nr:uncharacterized protein GSPATT00013945001 [Paramecium tetraurelia]CAK78515.1 unnamed protein product [Paramecium tetraurelia]|eukprot:XP_001445912.1 hypothetical protein (macronuclear) [Paramecium tetraurelia strain d4-2]
MQWIRDYMNLIIQTNLSPSLNSAKFITFQILIYYLQLTHFITQNYDENVFRLIKNISEICVLTPLLQSIYAVNVLTGILLILLNLLPYLIILHRKFTNEHQKVAIISKSLSQYATKLVNCYFLYFTWFLYLPQMHYIGWNFLSQKDLFLIVISTIILCISTGSLLISNIYFINFEFNEQSLRKHFTYYNCYAQLLIIPMAILNQSAESLYQLIGRIIHGIILFVLIYEAYVELPFGFSKYSTVYNRLLIMHILLFIFTSYLYSSPEQAYSLLAIMLILQPVSQYLFQTLIQHKRLKTYHNTVNQYYELLIIEDFFDLIQAAQKSKKRIIELIQKFSLHLNRCQSVKCQCKKIGAVGVLRQEDAVILTSCLFRIGFEKHRNDSKNLEIYSLKFLTFINKYRNNAPKSYQELKILFQKKREYSFYFIQISLLLQFILQAQMQKDEDYNINKDTRVSNVKLQVSKSERSIVQTLYQMEQIKQNLLPLLMQLTQFKVQFWKQYLAGKFSNFSEIEIEVKKLQLLKNQILNQLKIYQPIFYTHGRTFNVQFLKYSALIDLLLFNNVRKYFELERERREILQLEKSMNSFDITNINFFKGEAISVKVCIAQGPNIGKVLNEVISPLIPKFFGFHHFDNPMEAFLDFTKGNINTLMPTWLEPVHDEIMQNYIRRGGTARIGKYFQTFAKIYDKTLIRCQVYLAHNFSQNLTDDFTMIGCLKSLEVDQPKFIPGKEPKKIKDVAFKGTQHILFDVNGTILGITQGLYQMIERLQRIKSNQKVESLKNHSHEKSKSENSSIESESFDVYQQQWSNEMLRIDEFYQKVLIWMLLPFVPREIEQTGIEYLMDGETPPKNRYPNLVDLETSNSIVSNKETYLFIPEDINLFVSQYEKVLQKIMDDVRVQSNNFSSGSYKGMKSEYQESESLSAQQSVTIYNEKLCSFYFDQHLKSHQALQFGTTRQSEIQKTSMKPSSQSQVTLHSEEDSEQLKTKAEKIYYDKYTKYIEKITLQNFNPVPIIYSVNYEEYRYKKNDVGQKQQFFVIELVVNESQLLTTMGYKRQVRETIKQACLNFQSKRLLIEQQVQTEDSNSVQSNISEQISDHDGEIINYMFPTHPSHYYEDLYFQSPKLDQDSNQFQSNEDKNEPQKKQSINTQDSLIKGSFKLKFPERNLALKTMNKYLDRKRQQDFFNETDSKLAIDSRASQQQIQEEHQVKYSENLKLFDQNYKSIHSKMEIFKNPTSFKIQKYLLYFVLFLIIGYIILLTIAVLQQYNFNECFDLIELMLSTQQSYSQITHGLFRLELSNKFSIDKNLTEFYSLQIDSNLQNLINLQSEQLININQINFSVNQFYNIEYQMILNPTLQQTIQMSLAQFYKIKNNSANNSQVALNSIANLKEIGQLPKLAYDNCYDDQVQNEEQLQSLLTIYMLIIFFLVMLLQFLQVPLISKLKNDHRRLYKLVIKLQIYEVQDEIETYEHILSIFKKSLYEWMLIDFVQETRMFENSLDNIQFQTQQLTDQSQNLLLNNSNKKNKFKLLEKLKKQRINQFKYIIILMMGLIVILAYFLIIFFVIFILSQQLFANADFLFKFKLIQSYFINIINNIDLVSYNTYDQQSFINLMSQEEFNNYSLSLKSDQQDQYIEFNNNFASIVSDEQLQYNLQQINENNICLDQIGIACNETDSFKLNPNILQYYQHGMKYLITQIDKLIESQPHFFYDSINNNSFKQVQDFYSNNDHIVYIDYGSEILISAYAKLVETAHQEFDQALTIYKQTLLIFILSVGMMGLLIISMLGRLLLNMQQDSISTCQSSLLLISPKRYLNQNIAQLTQKKR